MEKNQKILIGILVVLIVILSGVTIYLAMSKYTYTPSVSQSLPTQTENLAEKVPPSQEQTLTQPQTQSQTLATNLNPRIKSLDDKWNLYTNEQAGFSIKIPKEINTGIAPEFRGDCPEKEVVNVFESGKYIYITGEYSLSSDEKVNCVKTNLELLKARWHTGENQVYNPNGWLIITGEARNDQELSQFIKNDVGSDCLGIMDKKADKNQPEVFDITIKNNPNGYCIMNFAYTLKYSPKTGKIFYVSMGQDQSFLLEPRSDMPFAEIKSADSDMINSFRFIGI